MRQIHRSVIGRHDADFSAGVIALTGICDACVASPHLHIMESTYNAGLMWFRRDLRAHDNAALFHSLKACRQVHCVFVFDRILLEPLPRRDRRVEFIRESLVELDWELRELAGLPGAG